MSLFDAFFPPQTPEERAQRAKARVELEVATRRKLEAALPHVKNALAELRHSVSLGVNSGDNDKARKHIAILIERIETAIASPVE